MLGFGFLSGWDISAEEEIRVSKINLLLFRGSLGKSLHLVVIPKVSIVGQPAGTWSVGCQLLGSRVIIKTVS
jgi:hypothetical protein